MNKINVTKTFLPPLKEYTSILENIWEENILTNNGVHVQKLEKLLCEFLNVKNLYCVNNGTTALQLALSSLNIKDCEVITTPFSYVATISSILWQSCTPVFVDIEADNFLINTQKIEEAITPKTKAILAVHVYGFACDVEAIEIIAQKHNLKVIYDGAHAFGVNYKGKSLLSYGDISTLSFHATKTFHTAEGGACVVNNEYITRKTFLQRQFGHEGDTHYTLGINAKLSELHAAMGITIFPYLSQIFQSRKECSELYTSLLKDCIQLPKEQAGLEYNYAYYPVIFSSEEELLRVFQALKKHDIYPRRYFFPALNTLPYVEKTSCPIAEDISTRIACLPLHPNLDFSEITKIAEIIKKNIDKYTD